MRSVLAALSVVLLLVGCSGDSRGSGGGGEAAPREASTRVDLTGQGSFEPDGIFTVAPQYAEPSADRLEVVVELTAADIPLTVGTKRALYAAGAELIKADAAPDVTVGAGESAEVVLTFAGEAVPLDGQVTFEVSVGGQPPTSVGFGLTG